MKATSTLFLLANFVLQASLAAAAPDTEKSTKRGLPLWYLAEADDAEDTNAKRGLPLWYLAKADDAEDTNTKRTLPLWYLAEAEDAEDANTKRGLPLWYLAKASDAEDSNDSVTKRQLAEVDHRDESMLVRSKIAPAVLARYLQNGGSVGTLRERAAMSLEEHQAASDQLKESVYGTMREEALRATSDRGRALLEFSVRPASDQVDREHVPEHLADMVATAINDQEKVALLNYYLLVTGREPRVASELGWNRTLEAPALLEKSDEVGYGYALGSQHQHHCANILADAIDLGKDNINDFWMIHVVHCLSLIKIYSEKLADYKEPVQPLTGLARDRLQKSYGMTDWEDDEGNIIKDGMLQRNPKYDFLSDSFCLERSAPGSDSLKGWVIFLIVEATIASLALCGMVSRMIWTKRCEKRRYTAVSTGRAADVEEKPFLEN